jgi:hypothetical protein
MKLRYFLEVLKIPDNLKKTSFSFQVDVIVNTTNDKVDLTANPCGKALLKVAGKELLNECKKIGSLQAGQMAPTGPAKLKCKRVYHVRSSAWDNGKGAPVTPFLFLVLLTCNNCYVRSCRG